MDPSTIQLEKRLCTIRDRLEQEGRSGAPLELRDCLHHGCGHRCCGDEHISGDLLRSRAAGLPSEAGLVSRLRSLRREAMNKSRALIKLERQVKVLQEELELTAPPMC
jgi:hypothetical protein